MEGKGTSQNSGHAHKKILSTFPSLPDSLIEQFLQTQHQKAVNESEEIKLRGKELDNNKELSSQFMEIKARLEASRPRETRKTYTRLAYIAGGFVIVFLLFTGFAFTSVRRNS